MSILFVVTDTKRKSLVFVTRELKVFSLFEMITAVGKGFFENIYAITGTAGTYIRSAPDKTIKNNIDALSITGPHLVAIVQGHAKSTVAIHNYIGSYLESIPGGAPYIEPVGSFRIPSIVVKKVFQSHAAIIKKAAHEFGIDQNTLGAIIVDEIARLYPFEPIFEKLGADIVGLNVSVGVAQVRLETANGVIQKGIYNPNPLDKKLPFSGNLTNKNRRYLYDYVIQSKHSIYFAAAHLHSLIASWMLFIDIANRPEILGTLYHLDGRKPHTHPESDERGEQIAGEFYRLAKVWLREK